MIKRLWIFVSSLWVLILFAFEFADTPPFSAPAYMLRDKIYLAAIPWIAGLVVMLGYRFTVRGSFKAPRQRTY